MAVADTALVTLAQARDRLGLSPDDTSRDDRLEALINEVSEAVQDAIGRDLRPFTSADDDPRTVTVPYRQGARLIRLTPLQAWEIDSVVIDGETIDPADYQLGPIAKPHGVWHEIYLASPVWTGSSFTEVAAVITGRFGWETITEQITGWVLDLIHDRWRNRFAMYADADGLVEPGDAQPLTIPYRIQDEMRALKIPRIVSV